MSASPSAGGQSAAAEHFAWTSAVGPSALAAALGGLAYLVVPLDACCVALPVLAATIGTFSALAWSAAARLFDRQPGARFAWKPLLVALTLVTAAWWSLSSVPIPTRRAQVSCERAMPALESWRAQHGSYPARLDDLGLPIQAVALRARYWAHGGGASYMFEIEDAGLLGGGWHWDSSAPGWERHDD